MNNTATQVYKVWSINRREVTNFNAIYQVLEHGAFEVVFDWQVGNCSDRP